MDSKYINGLVLRASNLTQFVKEICFFGHSTSNEHRFLVFTPTLSKLMKFGTVTCFNMKN